MMLLAAAAGRAGPVAAALAAALADDTVGIGEGYLIVAGSLGGVVAGVTGIILVVRHQRAGDAPDHRDESQ
jgi:hypothetical protein